MLRSQTSHPFEFYIIDRIESHRGHHYLRVDENVLWVVAIDNPHSGQKKIYCNQYVNEYVMEADELKKFHICLDAHRVWQAAREQKLQSVRATITGMQTINFQPEQTTAVIQHEYAVSYANSRKPILGSYGAGSCVILALYESKLKKALLAHIDVVTDLKCLDNILSGFSSETTVAHLIGGNTESLCPDFCLDIVEILEQHKIKIVNCDIVRNDYDPGSLAIDARNGNIYSPVDPYQLHTSGIIKRLEAYVLSSSFKNLTPLNKINVASESLQPFSSWPNSGTLFQDNKAKRENENYCGLKKGFFN